MEMTRSPRSSGASGDGAPPSGSSHSLSTEPVDPQTFLIRTCPDTGRETYCFFEVTPEGTVLHTERGSRRTAGLAWMDAHCREIERVEASALESVTLTYALQGKLDDAAAEKQIGAVPLALRHIHNSRTLKAAREEVEASDADEALGIEHREPGPYEGLATQIAQGGREGVRR